MRARPALYALAWLGFAQPDYEGCSCNDGLGDPRPLPLGEIECEIDADCTGEPCEIGVCWGGECRFRPVTDRDRDGAFPPPCGDDCDNDDSSIRPGAAEVCNFTDDDCDGPTDEGAPPTDVSLNLSASFAPTSVVLPSAEGALVVHTGDITERQLFAHHVAPGGAIEPPFEVGFFDTGPLAGARGNDGVYAVVVFGTVPLHALFERRPPGFTITRIVSTLRGLDSEVVTGLDIIPFGDSVAIAYDTVTRNVRIGLDGPDILVGNTAFPGVALATDGENLAVLDPEEDTLVFLDATGGLVARHAVPPTAGTRAIASGDGRVYVATVGGASFALTPVTATGGAAAGVPLPTGQPRLAWVDGLVVVAVDDGRGVWYIGVIDPTTGATRPGSITLTAGYDLSAERAAGGIVVSAGRAEVGFIQACGDLF